MECRFFARVQVHCDRERQGEVPAVPTRTLPRNLSHYVYNLVENTNRSDATSLVLCSMHQSHSKLFASRSLDRKSRSERRCFAMSAWQKKGASTTASSASNEKNYNGTIYREVEHATLSARLNDPTTKVATSQKFVNWHKSSFCIQFSSFVSKYSITLRRPLRRCVCRCVGIWR